MRCVHCRREREEHVLLNDQRVCVGHRSTYAPDLTTLSAEFIFMDGSTARSEIVTLVQDNRRLARIDNIVERLLREGATRISVNIDAST